MSGLKSSPHASPAAKRASLAPSAANGEAPRSPGVSLSTQPKLTVTDEDVITFLATQHAVKHWIEEVLEVPLLEDFMTALKSGVVLCYLMLEIDPRSIPKIQENTQIAFKLKENVEFFLHAAADLGVPRGKIFLPSDLIDGKNVVNVVECLVEVAKKAVEAHNFDVPIRLEEQLARTDNHFLLEELPAATKEQIRDTLLKKKRATAQRGTRVVGSTVMLRQLAFISGQKIDALKVERGVTKLQALWRGHCVRKQYKAFQRKIAFKDKIVHEVLSTEKSYLQSIDILISRYFNPLDEATKSKKNAIITSEDLKSIFSVVLLLIKNFNSKLLSDLEARISKWGPNSCIGDILLKHINNDFLKVYTKYVQNFDSALRTVDRLTKDNPKFESFLAEKRKDPALKGLDLGAYLITPVQRIPRYNMLLKELVKHTYEGHPDLANLKEAEENVAKVAETINEKKREAEQLATILPVSLTISRCPLYLPESHRKFLTQVPSGDGNWQIIVFSDIALVTKPLSGPPSAPNSPAELKKKRSSILGIKLIKRSSSSASVPKQQPTTTVFKWDYVEHYKLEELEFAELSTYELNITSAGKPLGSTLNGGASTLPLKITFNDAAKQTEFLEIVRGAKNNDFTTLNRTKLPTAQAKIEKGRTVTNFDEKVNLLSLGKSTEQLLFERKQNRKPGSRTRAHTDSLVSAAEE